MTVAPIGDQACCVVDATSCTGRQAESQPDTKISQLRGYKQELIYPYVSLISACLLVCVTMCSYASLAIGGGVNEAIGRD